MIFKAIWFKPEVSVDVRRVQVLKLTKTVSCRVRVLKPTKTVSCKVRFSISPGVIEYPSFFDVLKFKAGAR